MADARATTDPFEGLRRIGIDEISYRRGYKYLIVVVDHDTGALVWAKPDRTLATTSAIHSAASAETRRIAAQRWAPRSLKKARTVALATLACSANAWDSASRHHGLPSVPMAMATYVWLLYLKPHNEMGATSGSWHRSRTPFASGGLPHRVSDSHGTTKAGGAASTRPPTY